MKKLVIFIPIAILLALFACRKDSLNTQNTATPPGPQILIETGITGLVKDAGGQPLEGVTIYFDNQQANTDARGYFSLKGRGDSQLAVVRAEKTGYFPSLAGFMPEKGTDARLEIVLQEKSLAGTIQAASGGIVSFDNGNTVDFAAAAFVDDNGQPYTGEVMVYATYLDPSKPSIFRLIPSGFDGISEQGERQMLESYGMMHVLLESPGGQQLQISQPATLTMNVPADRLSAAPATIPLWFLDENTGYWKEEGEATLQNGRYVGQVSHFSWWNCDAGFPIVRLSGNVFVEDYHPVVEVRITRNNGSASRSILTSTDGSFTGMIPANESLLLEIFNNCGALLYSANIGPYNADVTLASIGLPWSNDWVAISGTLTNCDNNPVTNGYVSGSTGGDIFPLALDPVTGAFNGMVSNCGGSGGTLNIYGIDLDALTESDVQSYPISSGNINVGNLQACDAAVTTGITFIVDGTPVVFQPCTATAENVSGTSSTVYTATAAAVFDGKKVIYEFIILDWNNDPQNPLWGLSYNIQVVSPGANYYNPTAGGTLNVITAGSTLGSMVIFDIDNVELTEKETGIVHPNGTIKIVAQIQ